MPTIPDGGYERLERQPIQPWLSHNASLAQMGVTADALKLLGARVFPRPTLIVRAGYRAASRRVVLSLLEPSSLAGQS
jgi:hypothetical protein